MNKSDIEYHNKLSFLIKKIRNGTNSDGYKRYHKLNQSRTLFNTYLLNHNDLFKQLDRYYSSIETLDDSIKRRFRQKIIIKDLFNVLTSARSYVDILVDDVLDDNFHCFMKELRNYVTHFDTFPLTSRIIIDAKGKRRFESLNVSKMEDYLNLKIKEYPKRKGLKNALIYLKRNEKELNLNDILIEYFKKISEHYEAFVLRYVENNYKVLEELLSNCRLLQKEMKLIKLKKPDLLSEFQIRHLNWLLNRVIPID